MKQSCLAAASAMLVAPFIAGQEADNLPPLAAFPIPCFYVAQSIVDDVPTYALVCPLKMRHLEPLPAPRIPRHQRRLE